MTCHQAAVCAGLACGPTASVCVPSKNHRLKAAVDVDANAAVYNETDPLVSDLRG
jgi:hypothetical protein